MTKTFSKCDYLKVHEYALRYDGNDEQAAQELIEAFKLFIFRYANFLAYGVYDIGHTSLRNFISLYIKNKEYRKQLPMYKYKPYVSQKFAFYAAYTSALFDRYSFDELYNECVCVFLSMAKRYNDDRPSFHNYISKCYHYELQRGLKYLIKDPVVKISNPYDCGYNYSQNEHIYSYEALINDINKEVILKNAKQLTVTDENSVYDIESLNVNWINGITCSEEFSALTPFERELLINNYILKKTDTEIANELGLCRATVNRKKAQAKKTLYKALKTSKKINF